MYLHKDINKSLEIIKFHPAINYYLHSMISINNNYIKKSLINYNNNSNNVYLSYNS